MNLFKPSFENNNKGFTLISVLTVMAATAALGLAISSMILLHGKEVTHLEDKMAILSVTRDLELALLDNNYCTCLFAGTTVRMSDLQVNNLPTVFPRNYNSSCVQLGPSIEISRVVPNRFIVFTQLTMQNLVRQGADRIRGDLHFQFEGSLRSLRPGILPVSLQLGGSGAIRPVAGCRTPAGLSRCRVCISKNQGTRGVKPPTTGDPTYYCTDFVGPGESDVTVRVVDHGSGGREEAIGIECE